MIKRKNNETGFSTVVIVLVMVIVALTLIFGFMARTRTDKTQPATDITSSSTPAQSGEATTINTVINKGDYQGLAAYMASSVKVVKEGTDANGTNYSSTAAAKKILDFYTKSNGAQLPWDFTGDSA